MSDSDGDHSSCCMKKETLKKELDDPGPQILDPPAREVTAFHCISM